jgi:hypothetical protein
VGAEVPVARAEAEDPPDEAMAGAAAVGHDEPEPEERRLPAVPLPPVVQRAVAAPRPQPERTVTRASHALRAATQVADGPSGSDGPTAAAMAAPSPVSRPAPTLPTVAPRSSAPVGHSEAFGPTVTSDRPPPRRAATTSSSGSPVSRAVTPETMGVAVAAPPAGDGRTPVGAELGSTGASPMSPVLRAAISPSDQPFTVQREEVAPPAPITAAAPGVEPPAGTPQPTPGGPPGTVLTPTLFEEIYERVEQRMRGDLLFDRERKGLLADAS